MQTARPMASGSRKLLRDIMRPRKTVTSLPGALAAGAEAGGASPVLYSAHGQSSLYHQRPDAAESSESSLRSHLLMKSGSTTSIAGGGSATTGAAAVSPATVGWPAAAAVVSAAAHGLWNSASTPAGSASDGTPMNVLINDIKKISDSIFKMRSAIDAQSASDASSASSPAMAATAADAATGGTMSLADEAHTLEIRERLGDVLTTLQAFVNKYPALNSGPVLGCAAELITKVKSFGYTARDASSRSALNEAIEKVALSFSSSVLDHITSNPDCINWQAQRKDGPRETSFSNGNSGGNITNYEHVSATVPDLFSHAEADARLLRMEDGVEHALEQAKAWSKHVKDVISYLEKRTALELDFAKNLLKLVQFIHPSIKENSFQPFQPMLVTAIDQDKAYANTLTAACGLISAQGCVEPLVRCRSDYDKQRKVIKETWFKEVKRMSDCVTNMKKAKQLYEQRCQDYERAKDSAAKGSPTDALNSSTGMLTLKSAEKKKKMEDEAFQRAKEAETVYKSCVHEANSKQKELVKVKEDTLRQTRELIIHNEQKVKTALGAYYQLQHAVTDPLPTQYGTLHERCLAYEPGDQYAQYVRHLSLPSTSGGSAMRSVGHHQHQHHQEDGSSGSAAVALAEPFVFEPYVSEGQQQPTPQASSHHQQHRMTLRKSGGGGLQSTHDLQATGSNSVGVSDVASYISDDYRLKASAASAAAAAAAAAPGCGDAPASESESHESSENKSHDSSPSASPRTVHRRQGSDSLSNFDGQAGGQTFKGVALSKAAGTHALRRLRAPSRCRACESYVYLQGAECEKCDLTCHNKCLETLNSVCQRPTASATAPGSAARYTDVIGCTVPVLVSRCIDEIDERGLEMRGIYRVSGVKSKVEKLCQSFELSEGTIADDEELSKQHPSVISNVLKLYLRQLPEPLLTVHLYHDFIAVAKEQASGQCSDKMVVSRLREIVQKLPAQNYATARLLMHHLRRVSLMEDDNQMNACNLGIVFGPTLLRANCDEGTASLMTLLDTPHQARAVELLIRLSEDIFGPDEKTIDQAAAAGRTLPDEDSLSNGSSSSSQNFRSVDSNNLTDEILHALEDGSKDFGRNDGTILLSSSAPTAARNYHDSELLNVRNLKTAAGEASDSDADESSADHLRSGRARLSASGGGSDGGNARDNVRATAEYRNRPAVNELEGEGAGGGVGVGGFVSGDRRAVMRSASSPFPSAAMTRQGLSPAADLNTEVNDGNDETEVDGSRYVGNSSASGAAAATVVSGRSSKAAAGRQCAPSQCSDSANVVSPVLCTAMTLSSSPGSEGPHAAVRQQALDSCQAATLRAFDAEVASGKALYSSTLAGVSSGAVILRGSENLGQPLAKSASATRVVFYSDVDSTMLAPPGKTSERRPAAVRLPTADGVLYRSSDLADLGRPRNAFYPQSMKRKSDEPKFV